MQIIDDPFSGNIFGRLGKGIGKGLSEQLPKEIDRSRLKSGLNKLREKNIEDPFEFFIEAITQPGITPQMVQSLSDLSRQRLKNRAYTNGLDDNSPAKQLENYGYKNQGINGNADEQRPSVTTAEPLGETIDSFIPRGFKDLEKAGAEAFKLNPAKYQNDINNAIAEQAAIDEANERRNNAFVKKRDRETQVLDNIRNKLTEENKALGNLVPDTVYSNMEDKAIKSILPKDKGGEGLTEQQAAKKYAQELKRISEDYSSIKSFGKYPMFSASRPSLQRKLKNLQGRMIERGEQKEFSEELISKAGLSPFQAIKIAYPLEDKNSAKLKINELPDLNAKGPLNRKKDRIEYKDHIPEIAKSLDKNTSPISIASYLEQRGYDSNEFLNYLEKHQDTLLTGWQKDQLKFSKQMPKLNDLYLFPELFSITG